MSLGRSIFTRCPLNKLVLAFLLLFQATFLNVIVPGHTRGIITLTGNNSIASAADLGCPFCCPPLNADPKKTPTRQDRTDCAICHLALRLTISPVFDFGLGELGLLELAPPPAPEPAPICIVITGYFCRGPPPFFV